MFRERPDLMNTITVYTRPGCVQCGAVQRAFAKAGMTYRTVDVSADPDARDFVMALGYLQVPVVYAGPTRHFCGFRPDRIQTLIAASA